MGRGAGDDAPQGGVRRYPRRGRTGGHVYRRGGRSGAGSPADSGRGRFLGSGADPVEGVNSPETTSSAAAEGRRTACVFPSGPPYRDSYTSRFSAAM